MNLFRGHSAESRLTWIESNEYLVQAGTSIYQISITPLDLPLFQVDFE